MELNRRLDYGFNGYQVPPIPRGARSARRRGVNTRKADVCAFDLLATLAGKILLEGESTPSSVDMGSQREESEVIKDSLTTDKQDEDKNVNSLCNNQGNGDGRSFIVSELVLQAPRLNEVMKDLPPTPNEACSGPLSVITTSGSSEKVGSAGHLANTEFKVENRILAGKADIELFGCRVSPACKFEAESKKPIKVEPNDLKLAISSRGDEHNTERPKTWDKKPSYLKSSNNSVKSLPKDQLSGGSLPRDKENVNVDIRDDDEHSSGCTQPSTGNKAFKPSARTGDRRVRKLLSSKYWKVSPNSKDADHYKANAERKHIYHNGNSGFKRLRSQRDYPFKKRKFYQCSSPSNSGGDFGNDGICSSQANGSSKDASAAMFPKATGTSNSEASEHEFLQSNDSPVKLKIKSFRVPEFFIEIPETATVGDLKKTVMEAVTAILSGELRVGMLLQGKKIRDDSKTLLQTGITHDNKLDAVGFSLEPNLSQASPPLHPEDHSYRLSCENPKPISRYPPAPIMNNTTDTRGTFDALTDSPGATLNNLVESDHDSAPSPPDMSLEKTNGESQALVAVPAMNVEALNAVPTRKSKRAEAAQRRIRRPFSVSEVEGLVQAVEKLGTGRWRDVKLRAFEHAKHRTYVDLKDKWKTLVHTARISPQQRRGEPVPQELLDRVLTAHAYWSQQQVKPQYKQHAETCRLL